MYESIKKKLKYLIVTGSAHICVGLTTISIKGA